MPHDSRHIAAGQVNGSTIIERMRRGAPMPTVEPTSLDIPRFLHLNPLPTPLRGLVEDVADQNAKGVAGVRFVRGEADGSPAVVMEERGEANAWQVTWSLPTDSADAREGMIGWLNTQGDRWPRIARMLHRRASTNSPAGSSN